MGPLAAALMDREERRRAFHAGRVEGEVERALAARAEEDNVLRNSVFDVAAPYTGPRVAGALSGALDFVPVVGDLNAFEDARNAAVQGDYGRAAFDAATGVVGLVPGLGDALAAGAKTLAPAMLGAIPAIRGPAMAEEVARLLREGRAADVTDDMLARLDAEGNARLFDLYEQGATGVDMPMDAASRAARAEEMGFDLAPRRLRRNDPAAEAAYSEADRALADALGQQRIAQAQARAEMGGLPFSEAQAVARQEAIEGKISLRDVTTRAFELAYPGNARSATPAADAAVEAASAARRTADDARHMEVSGMFHGSPDISWAEDAGAGFDASRTHDMNLAYGQSPAYTTEDPRVGSGYSRPGASWGNRGTSGQPGVFPLAVRSKNPFDLNATFSSDEAREILGDEAFSTLSDNDTFTGREIWNALVQDMPSYHDLRIESRLFGGEVEDLLPKTEANRELREQGFDALRHVDHYNPAGGGPHRVLIPFDANQLRSRFARFDPRLAHLRNLSAGIGGGVVAYNALNEDEQQ